MLKIKPQQQVFYTDEEINKIKSEGWTWRPSTLWPDTQGIGIWIKRIQEECPKHGMTEHVRVLQETSLVNCHSICCECDKKVRIKREREKLRKERMSFL